MKKTLLFFVMFLGLVMAQIASASCTGKPTYVLFDSGYCFYVENDCDANLYLAYGIGHEVSQCPPTTRPIIPTAILQNNNDISIDKIVYQNQAYSTYLKFKGQDASGKFLWQLDIDKTKINDNPQITWHTVELMPNFDIIFQQIWVLMPSYNGSLQFRKYTAILRLNSLDDLTWYLDVNSVRPY